MRRRSAWALAVVSCVAGSTAAPRAAAAQPVPSPTIPIIATPTGHPAAGALPTLAPTPAGSVAPLNTGSLTGPIASYAWLAGRWACRTATADSKDEPAPARLWVVVDPKTDSLRQSFSMTDKNGKPYRSDDTLLYDAKSRTFVRRTVDVSGANVMLAARAPYTSSMDFVGIVGTAGGKIYRMRATVAVDPAHTQFSTATAFYSASSKAWVVQTTGVCSRISG